VEPKNTSKQCSRYGDIGIMRGELFKCLRCGHVNHDNVNASFNIALCSPLVENIRQSHVDMDSCEGCTDTTTLATSGTMEMP